MLFIARPTSGGVIFGLLALAATGTAVMNVGLMTALTAAVLDGLLFSGFLFAQFSLFRIRVERPAAADVSGGSIAVLPLRIINLSIFYREPIVVCEKTDFYLKQKFNAVTPPLAPRQKITLRREVPADRRGHYTLGKLWLISGDPCGFFRKKRVFQVPGEITITPKITPLTSLSAHRRRSAAESGEGNLLGHAGIGGDFFGMRPYRPGDEIRHVHWRGTAAKGCLMVKEFEASVTDRIVIALDTWRPSVGQDPTASNFEELVGAAASLTEYLGARYCNLSFAAGFGDDDVLQISGDAAGVRLKIIEALTEITPSECPFDRLLSDLSEDIQPGSTLFLLSMSCEAESLELMRLMTDSGIWINWIYAPSVNFPPIEPDQPRTPPDKPVQIPAYSPVAPIVVDFESRLAELLKNEDIFEKI